MKLFNRNYPKEELIVDRCSWLYYIYGTDEYIDKIVKERSCVLDMFCTFFDGHELVRKNLHVELPYAQPGILIYQTFKKIDDYNYDSRMTPFVIHLLKSGWEIEEI